ncbi:MAG: metallophosphoesterase [Gemmatimonadota bacterium]|nr:metallophosphoesterase [Gemmatimonadota bacterium]MDH3423569.1 metallophosphoesterase [Gemmatimonadota bacterium]
MLTVLHASDFQCGRPFRAAAAEALLRLAAETDPDVVVVSGDLTQRAKAREFRVAKRILDRMPRVPVVVTPGNHDVPLFRIFERALTPYKNWRAAISPELDTVTRVQGATLVALNSSAPRRAIVNGRIDDDQLDFAHRAFATSPVDDIRGLVIHHHFVPPPDGRGGRPLPRARLLASRFESMGVDLVLGGHVHQTHITTSRDLLGADRELVIPFIACGTTTSWRGRGPEADRNSLNVVHVRPGHIEIVPHRMAAGGDTFEPGDPVSFARPAGHGTAPR